MLRARRLACAAAWARSASYVGNICQGKIDPAELFPFPTSALPQHVKESMIDARSAAKDSADSWGLLIPDHFGGQGFPHPCVFDVVSHMSADRYSSLHFHTLASFLIRSFASKEHMGRYLPGMTDASMRIGWAVDEFGTPNDPCGRAAASFLEAKASFEVSCSKVVCSDPDPTAFVLLCNLQRGERNQLGWMFIERNHPGAKYENGVLVLDRAVVPMDNVFIGQGDGYRSSMTALLTGQYLTAACVTQIARNVAGRTAPAVALQLHAQTYAVESCAAALAANIEKGVSDTFMESSLLATLTRGLFDNVRALPEAPKDASVENLLAGIAPLAKAAACCGLEDMAQVFAATSTLEMMQIRTMRMLGFIDRFPTLECDPALVKRCENLVVTFGESVERIAVRQGITSVDRDIVLNRTAEAAALLFASAAVLSRSHRAASGKVPTAATERELAALWCTTAMDRVDALLSVTGATSADSAHARVAADLLAE